MTRVLNAEEREIVNTNYSQWHIYKLLAEPAQEIALMCHPFFLSPEEVFYETFRIVDHIRIDEPDELEYSKKLWGDLYLLYRGLSNDNDNSSLCASIVTYSVISLLLLYKGGRPSHSLMLMGEPIAKAGHFDIITRIFTISINHHHIDNSVLTSWRDYYESDESVNAKLLQEFLSPSAASLALPPRTASEEEIRISIIRGVWSAAKQNQKIQLNKSSIFYVYRIMAEEGWYKIDSYTQFMLDVESAEIEADYRPALSVYSRKNKEFKPEDHFLDTIGQTKSYKPILVATAKYLGDYTLKLSRIYR